MKDKLTIMDEVVTENGTLGRVVGWYDKNTVEVMTNGSLWYPPQKLLVDVKDVHKLTKLEVKHI